MVRKGPAIKTEVDDAIDLCAEAFNLRESIEESRAQCEQATDERQKKALANKGTRPMMTLAPQNHRDHPSFTEPKEVLRTHRLPGIPTLHRA